MNAQKRMKKIGMRPVCQETHRSTYQWSKPPYHGYVTFQQELFDDKEWRFHYTIHNRDGRCTLESDSRGYSDLGEAIEYFNRILPGE